MPLDLGYVDLGFFVCMVLFGEFLQNISVGPYGSGTIIDPDGTILTSASCVAESLNSRKVSKSKVGA